MHKGNKEIFIRKVYDLQRLATKEKVLICAVNKWKFSFIENKT